jgi:ABC-type glycerol-3-phosphate transport system substrate-binding protein
MNYFKFLILILALLLLVGCTADESDRVFEEVLQQRPDLITQEDDGTEETTQENRLPVSVEPPFGSDLYGTLTVLTNAWDTHTTTLAERFMEIHPGVNIVIERLDANLEFMGLAEQTALITRLLANPPDIFDTAPFAFEKLNFEQVFLDLNAFIDGPSGVNREDYFDNILRAAEVNDSLYSVPLLISNDAVLLNKRYFEAIGVSIDEMRTITLQQLLEYHQRAAQLFPEDNIGIDQQFHMMDVFRFERVHDVGTGVVNANTPEMREMLEYINSVRLGTGVEYLPEEVIGWIRGHFGIYQVDTSFTNPGANYMYHNVIPVWVFFMQDHPTMQFSHPVHRMTQGGNTMFRPFTSLAIMRDSENQELAWEFVRFCMEYSDNLFEYDRFMTAERITYTAFTSYPVNRQLFHNQFGKVLDFSYEWLSNGLGPFGDLLDSANRDTQVEYALFRFIEFVELINAQCRFDQMAMNSIIYPDIFQFHLGNQDVYATLRSIQNRLELYVAE